MSRPSLLRRLTPRSRRQPDPVPTLEPNSTVGYQFARVESTRYRGYTDLDGPSLEDAKIRIRQFVEALPQVDAGTAGSADRVIDTWRAQWYGAIEIRYKENEESVEELVALANSHLGSTRTAVVDARADVRVAEREYAKAHQRFHGELPDQPMVEDDPATTADLDEIETEISVLITPKTDR